MAEPHVEYLRGPEIEQRFEQLAELRMRVFAEWPYLYAGTVAEEREFLQYYIESSQTLAVVVVDGSQVVGLSTAMPLTDESPRIQRPFVHNDWDPARILYLAESILLPDYRGQGFYRHFFEAREAHARRLGGYDWTTFCGVIRPKDHPQRPADYQPLDPIWQHFGYEPRQELVAWYPWLDIGENEETEKPLQFWVKPVSASP